MTTNILPRNRHKRGEIESVDSLAQHLARSSDLRGLVLQGVDLSGVDLAAAQIEDVVLLGCTFRDRAHQIELSERGAVIFPRLNGLPYDTYRSRLYTVEELLDGYEEGGYPATRDFKIYAHFDRERNHPGGVSLRESLAQRLHDHGIDDAIAELIEAKGGRGVVGIMGGHGTRRSDPYFTRVARLAWRLTREGFFVGSGGGPGIMEAANLGAFFANYADPSVLDAAVEVLAQADRFDGGQTEGTPEYLQAIRDYFQRAREVTERFGANATEETARAFDRERAEPGESLAIPTWFYGHEPSNLFSTHIAKYFSNSLREDGLLAIATGGVVYAPGSAGTLQEVFMDLAQNHYATFTYRSPMVFLGTEYYADLFGLIQRFVDDKKQRDVYGDMLGLFDDPEEVAKFLADHPARPRAASTPLYELT